jgi:DNA-binding NarL/FixJ family response regulator
MREEGPTAIVCDDAPGFRALMRAMLTDAGLQVVGEAETWEDAERLAAGVDVVVVDLWMPQPDVEALARVRSVAGHATLALVTALAPEDAAERVAGVEVDLLLSKTAPPAEVAQAIAAHARERAAAS